MRRFLPASILAGLALVAAACGSTSPKAGTPEGGGTSSQTTVALPPGFSVSNGRAAESPGVLDVAPATDLQVSQLHKVELPSNGVTTIAQAIVNKAVSTTVRPLLINTPSLVPGEKVTVAAGDLGSGARHDALFILQGPTKRYQRLVQVNFGVAVGVVTIPTDLSPGTWALGVMDLTKVSISGGQKPAGTVLLDLAVFTV